jgi:Amt family ammonium transporter
LLLFFGWLGFNGGSTFAFNKQVPGIILNTVLSGVGGMVAAMIFSQLKFQRIEVEELINGLIGGLVAITACCHVIPHQIALIIGATGAAFTHLTSYALQKWGIDDAVDAVAVHGGAGIWGTICVALFGELNLINNGLSRLNQLLVQLLGSIIALIWAFGLTWLILKLIARFLELRVSAQEEQMGLNMSEHQAKTDTYELFEVMDLQAKTSDLTLRVPVEPFTEIGHIATRYNQVMDTLERNHRQNAESLEELYAITAIAVSAVENETLSPDDFEIFSSRPDELGILARALQQMLTIINHQKQELTRFKGEDNQTHAGEKDLLLNTISELIESKFVGNSKLQVIIERLQLINDLSQISLLLKQVIMAENIEQIENFFDKILSKGSDSSKDVMKHYSNE